MSPLPHPQSPANMSHASESSLGEVSPACSPHASPASHQLAASRHRKSASSGGSRAWSEEEVSTSPIAHVRRSRAHDCCRKLISSRPVHTKCRTSTSLRSSRRRSSPAGCTTTNSLSVASVGDVRPQSPRLFLWIAVLLCRALTAQENRLPKSIYQATLLHKALMNRQRVTKTLRAPHTLTYPSSRNHCPPPSELRTKADPFGSLPKTSMAFPPSNTSIWSVSTRSTTRTVSISGP